MPPKRARFDKQHELDPRSSFSSQQQLQPEESAVIAGGHLQGEVELEGLTRNIQPEVPPEFIPSHEPPKFDLYSEISSEKKICTGRIPQPAQDCPILEHTLWNPPAEAYQSLENAAVEDAFHKGLEEETVESWEPQPEQELQDVIQIMTSEEASHEWEVESSDNEEIIDFGDNNSGTNGDSPLYAGANITLHQSLLSILTLCLSFRLTGVCLKAVLDLISLHLPDKNIFRTSLAFFKNHFSYMQGAKSYEYYCSKCFKKLLPYTKCTCKKSKVCYLVKLSLHQQLQELLNRKGFYSKLHFNHNHEHGCFADVYDGDLYQELFRSGKLTEDVLTFQWYTDGAALYKSSNTSVWPLYLSINELPYNERCKKENLLVPVIWCGPVKPPSNILLTALYPELKELDKGVNFMVEGKEKNIKGILLNGTGDTPARSLMLNIIQFNGACSCQVCEQTGEPRRNTPGVRLYPFKPKEMVIRTLDSMRTSALKGTEAKPDKGVKGESILDKLMPDYRRGTAIDGMHQLYGGVSKKILKSIISTKKKDKKWSVSQYLREMDERLLGIKPPIHTSRTPRSLIDVSYWKTSEEKAWLNDYSLPVLNGILPDRYLLHHGTLVAASHLLNADVVTSQSISTAKDLLTKYTSQVPDFYEPNFMTLNFHLLFHLAELVTDLGPGWVYSCFPFESINGVILSLVHGTRWAEKQIATSIQLVLGLPDLVNKLPDSETKSFCLKIMDRKKYRGREIVDGSVLIGTCVLWTDVPLDISDMLQQTSVSNGKVYKFHSLRRGRYVYVATSRKHSKCRDSSAVVYSIKTNNTNIGVIQNFLKVVNCECKLKCSCVSQVFAIVKLMKVFKNFATLLPGVYVPNVSEYISTDEIQIISPSQFQGACVLMNIENRIYIAKPLNTKEAE